MRQLPPDPIIAVPDINVYISGAGTSSGYPRQVMQLWEDKQFLVATSEPILAKMRRVFLYPRIQKFTHWYETQVDSYLETLRASALVVSGNIKADVSSDPEDNKFFACAIEAEADYIISGDEKHVLPVGEYQGVHVISPRDFVETVMNIRKAA